MWTLFGNVTNHRNFYFRVQLEINLGLPLTCAGDLRGLLMVALRSQGNWRWEGPLGTPLGLVHWKRASSPVEAGTAGYLWFQTPIAGSLQTGDQLKRLLSLNCGINILITLGANKEYVQEETQITLWETSD